MRSHLPVSTPATTQDQAPVPGRQRREIGKDLIEVGGVDVENAPLVQLLVVARPVVIRIDVLLFPVGQHVLRLLRLTHV